MMKYTGSCLLGPFYLEVSLGDHIFYRMKKQFNDEMTMLYCSSQQIQNPRSMMCFLEKMMQDIYFLLEMEEVVHLPKVSSDPSLLAEAIAEQLYASSGVNVLTSISQIIKDLGVQIAEEEFAGHFQDMAL
jgi:hypothetical protein